MVSLADWRRIAIGFGGAGIVTVFSLAALHPGAGIGITNVPSVGARMGINIPFPASGTCSGTCCGTFTGTITSGTTTVLPSCWTSTNTIEAWGGGQGGTTGTKGGTGGWFAEIVNSSISGTATYAIGTGGANTHAQGGDTWWVSTNSLDAPGGASATSPVGVTTFSGGASADGGGGAGGPDGAGKAASGGSGGAGDNGSGGAGGTSCSTSACTAGTGTANPLGGGGAGGSTGGASSHGGAGGAPGGGGGGAEGGGSSGGSGAGGQIVVIYTN